MEKVLEICDSFIAEAQHHINEIAADNAWNETRAENVWLGRRVGAEMIRAEVAKLIEVQS